MAGWGGGMSASCKHFDTGHGGLYWLIENRGRQLPQRSGLRERRAADACRLTQPIVTETWVAEEHLDLKDIKKFFERCG